MQNRFSKRVVFYVSVTLLATLTALTLIWLEDRQTFEFLSFTRTELQSLSTLEGLRNSLGTTLDGQRSKQAQSLRFVREQVEQIKRLGHHGKLILDPQLDIFYLAYLCTLKLPERALAQAELVVLAKPGLDLAGRVLFLRQLLIDQLQEEARALELALDHNEGVQAESLRSLQRERNAYLMAFRPEAPKSLRTLVDSERRFWALCQQLLESTLKRREENLVHQRFLRQSLVLGILIFAATVGWLLLRRDSSAALRVSEQNYRTLYDSIPIPAFVCELKGQRILSANPAAAQLLELPLSSLIGMNISDFVPEEQRHRFLVELQRRDTQKEIRELQKAKGAKGRQMIVEVYARYIEIQGKGCT